MVNKILILGCISLILSGCAGSNKNKFDCPFTDGARCLPLGEIDARIDAGMQMNKQEEKGVFRKLDPVPQEDRITGEEVVEIWFAPQAGEDGRYTGERRTAFSLGASNVAPLHTPIGANQVCQSNSESGNDR